MAKNSYSKPSRSTSNKLGQHSALPTMRRVMNAIPSSRSTTATKVGLSGKKK